MYKFINVWINYLRLTLRIIAFHVFAPFILLYVNKIAIFSELWKVDLGPFGKKKPHLQEILHQCVN